MDLEIETDSMKPKSATAAPGMTSEDKSLREIWGQSPAAGSCPSGNEL